MNKPINVFIDNCVLYNSLKNSNELSKEQEWLKQEILSIEKIIELKKKGFLKVEHDLNIMTEKHRGGSDREIDELWEGIGLGSTFLNFQGVMGNPEEVEEGFTKPMRKRCEYLKNIFRYNKLDITHLVHAEFYGVEYFVTTDRKLMKKINAKDKNILTVKVLSPTDFLKEHDVTEEYNEE